MVSLRPLISALLVFTAALLGGCATTSSTSGENPDVPQETAVAVIRPGDTIRIELQSIPDPATLSVQVDDEGEISLRYLGRITAAGLTPSELARRITEAYIENEIYRENVVDVSVALSERYIYVGGEVQRPGRVLWTPDLTLTNAITAAGGFSLYARETGVLLNRDESSYEINARLAERNPGEDIPLLPGDRISVPRSAF